MDYDSLKTQDLKDFARQAQVDVVYSETGRDRDGKGFVEFENGADLKTAVEKLDKREFKGATVHCSQDIQDERPADKSYRQRSPPRGRYGAPSADDYYSRGPPRGYSPRGYNRERSPRGRPDDYYGRGDYGRRTPPRDPYGPPMPPRREPYGYDPYDRGGPPPPRGYADPYARNGDPYTGRPRTPPRGTYGSGYPAYERY